MLERTGCVTADHDAHTGVIGLLLVSRRRPNHGGPSHRRAARVRRSIWRGARPIGVRSERRRGEVRDNNASMALNPGIRSGFSRADRSTHPSASGFGVQVLYSIVRSSPLRRCAHLVACGRPRRSSRDPTEKRAPPRRARCRRTTCERLAITSGRPAYETAVATTRDRARPASPSDRRCHTTPSSSARPSARPDRCRRSSAPGSSRPRRR